MWYFSNRFCVMRGIGEAGIALDWQSRDQEFEPPMLHHNEIIRTFIRLDRGSDFLF